MASGGGLGRFARGKPNGNDTVPATASGGSTFEDPESAWMEFQDESTGDFGFSEFQFQDVSAQEFDLEEQSSRHDTPLVGLRLFKSPPTNARIEENREPHNELKDKNLDTSQAPTCMKPQHAVASSSDGASADIGPSGSLAVSVHSDSCLESSDSSQQKLSRTDASIAMQMHDSIDSSACLSVSLTGGEQALASSLAPTLPESSNLGAKASAVIQETSNSSRSSSGSITVTKPWYDVEQLFLTANESTRVIPIPRSVEKIPPGIPVEDLKKQATSHIFTPPGHLVRNPPPASHTASEQAVHTFPMKQIPASTQLPPGSHKTISTPTEWHRGERPLASTIPVVTPGDASATHANISRTGNFVPDGHDKFSVSSFDEKATLPREPESRNGTRLDQGLDFEELHAKFLSDIRDLEDLQDGNTSRLLFMQGMFATSYAATLKDQANLLDLISNLEKVAATAQETIARFQARNEY